MVDLHQKSTVMQGVDGKKINMYGYANIGISFDESHLLHTVIVCDITPEGILGQDFLLKHIKTWDLDVPCLRTRHNTVIPLATGSETQVVGRVLIKDKTQIPVHSNSFVPRDIVNGKQPAAAGYLGSIENDGSLESKVVAVSGKKLNSLAAMDHGEEYIAVCHAANVAARKSSYSKPKENKMVTDSEIVLQLQAMIGRPATYQRIKSYAASFAHRSRSKMIEPHTLGGINAVKASSYLKRW